MPRRNTLLRIAVLSDATCFFPLHQFVRLIYSSVVCWLLQFDLQRHASAQIQLFARRSSKEKITRNKFNIFFSDLDIGVCLLEPNDIDAVKNRYHLLRSLLIFLGELELYFFSELEEVESIEKELGEIYRKLRDMRKIGWLKGQLLTQERNNYHRYKDHRAMKIIKANWGLSSSHRSILNAIPEIKQFTTRSSEQAMIPHNFSFSVFCPYLFKRISVDTNSTCAREWLFIMCCTPPLKRGSAELDRFVESIRNDNPTISSLFLKLNRIELLIARAFIRGTKSHEAWHTAWLYQLSEAEKMERKTKLI